MLACDSSTSSRDPNRVNFPHSRAGTLPLATAASRLTLGTCILYDKTNNQHIGQPGGNAVLVWRLASCVSLSYLKLDGKRSTLPAYLGPIPYGQDHTRTIDGRRPGHRDGDALVQLLQPGAMVGKSVITHSLFPTFIPSCPALPDLPPHLSTTHPSLSSAAAARIIPRCKSPSATRQDHPAHLQKGTKLPYWSPHYAICNNPTLLLHTPQTQGATNTYPPGLPRNTLAVTDDAC